MGKRRRAWSERTSGGGAKGHEPCDYLYEIIRLNFQDSQRLTAYTVWDWHRVQILTKYYWWLQRGNFNFQFEVSAFMTQPSHHAQTCPRPKTFMSSCPASLNLCTTRAEEGRSRRRRHNAQKKEPTQSAWFPTCRTLRLAWAETGMCPGRPSSQSWPTLG